MFCVDANGHYACQQPSKCVFRRKKKEMKQKPVIVRSNNIEKQQPIKQQTVTLISITQSMEFR